MLLFPNWAQQFQRSRKVLQKNLLLIPNKNKFATAVFAFCQLNNFLIKKVRSFIYKKRRHSLLNMFELFLFTRFHFEYKQTKVLFISVPILAFLADKNARKISQVLKLTCTPHNLNQFQKDTRIIIRWIVIKLLQWKLFICVSESPLKTDHIHKWSCKRSSQVATLPLIL